MIQTLDILRFGTVDLETLQFLKNKLEQVFTSIFKKIEIIKHIHKIPRNAYDPVRDQYLSPLFLQAIRIFAIENNYAKVLGITTVDLFVHELNFVFGQAEFGPDAKAAIISLHRLSPEFYHCPSNKNLYLTRVVKEGIHEIGHTLGLEHCQGECIMMFSNSILDTDRKPPTFCAKCLKKIRY
ncbi:MAG: archaemetzincin family Zn-dependent metalloprotease [Candidatus Helarchaeota archaeon]